MPRDWKSAQFYPSQTDAEKARSTPTGRDNFWWDIEDPDERAKRATDIFKALEQIGQERKMANLRYARLYENVDLDVLGGSDFATAIVRQALVGRGIVRLNVVAAALDTLAAKITKNKPRPMFLTSGESWDMQIRARGMNKFGIGLFHETKIHEVLKESFVDAGVFGTGFAHVFFNDAGRLEVERVLPDEIFIDDNDGRYAKPRMMGRRKWIQREMLIKAFPEKADRIYDTLPPLPVRYSTKITTPLSEVWEAWHLPSAPKAGDGKHIIFINGVELFSEPWTISRFPFVEQRFKKRLVGFWGKGVAETLTGIQIELNRLMNSVSEQLRRKGRGRIYLQKGSSVNPAHMTNGIADIVYFVGTPPIVEAANAIAPEEFQQIDRMYQKAFQEVGISELSAAAKKPSGLDAAVALREFSDIESERFALTHQAWETAHLDFMDLSLELLDAHRTGGYKVKLPNKRTIEEIDYKDIRFARDSFVMQVFPVSSLPQTPAARYQRVVEIMNDGFIDKPTASRLLDYPDIEAELSLGSAARDDVDATISAILDAPTPKLETVEAFQDAKLVVERATAAYLFAKQHDCPEERLDLLRQLISDAASAVARVEQAAMAAQAGPAMAGPMPGQMPSLPAGPPAPSPSQGPLGARIGGDISINAAPPVAPVSPPVVA